MTPTTDTATKYAEANHEQFQMQLIEWLRIPSISTDPKHNDDVRNAADWLAEQMRAVGLENVAIMPTPGHPVVYADWLHAGDDAPTVLVYGHYDVQPAVTEDGWTHDPFEPQVQADRLIARGATDDKGQVMIQLKAAEALLKTNECPVNLKYIIEGEEEIGSPHLADFVKEHQHLLRADCCMISDTTINSEEQPSIVYSLRGLLAMDLIVRGPQRDMHSGYGGMIHNPAQAIAEIVAKLHDDEGRVTVPGFYDEVRDLSDEEREQLKKSDFTPQAWQAWMGDLPEYGERTFSKIERVGARPTLEVNGIFGGYTGDGFKTVLPAEARAKLSCRLVADQNPRVIFERIQDYVRQISPQTAHVELRLREFGLPAITPIDHPAVQAAAQAYQQIWNTPVLYVRGGGSIPIVAEFQALLGVPVVLLGFGLPDCGAHGPNENFSLTMYRRGIQTVIAFLHGLANAS
jgi:acetylornithine deacetylase/succinyl-diaminopimelate desuccinylase-like protein